jgi:AcrR family transcriptional regulator
MIKEEVEKRYKLPKNEVILNIEEKKELIAVEEKIDPRVKRTRKLLLDAFLGLLAEKSYEEITIQEIATRATVNRATFYAHFVDKCALVDDFIREVFAATLQHHQTSATADAQDYLRSLFMAVIAHLTSINSECPQRYQMFESLAEAQIKQQLHDNIRSWLSTHPLYSGHNSERIRLAATIISCSLYGAARQWVQNGGEQPAETFSNDALLLISATVNALNDSPAPEA